MPNFQEFVQKRQEQRNQAAQYQQPGAIQAERPQASSNRPQQPRRNASAPQPDNISAGTGELLPSAGGSAVNSSGRVTPGGPPPLWQQQQQIDGQTARMRADAANLQLDRDHELTIAQTRQSPSRFDPNNFTPVTTDPAQRDYWNFAMQQQQNIPNFFSTLQAGTPVSGSPGRVWQQNPAGEWGTVDLAQANTVPGLPSTYQPMQYSAWDQPDQGEAQQGGNDLLAYMLANPESLSDDVVSQMKGQQQDMATSMNKQLLQAVQGDAAARGLSGGGGERASINNTNAKMTSDLLGGYRDIDIKKAMQDRIDQRNVLGDASAWMSDEQNRASDSYANRLRGETAQDASNQFLYNMRNQNEQQALTRALQERLGMADVGLGRDRLGEDRRQFDQMFPLNAANILGNLGLGYGNLDLNNRQFESDDGFRRNNAVLQWLFAGR